MGAGEEEEGDIFASIDDLSDGSDADDDDAKKKSERLMRDIKQLGGKSEKTRKKISRTQSSKELSTSNWASGKSDKLQLGDLVGTLKSSTLPVAKVKKKL